MKDKMEKNGAVIMQKYELGRLLGQGTFAKVYYARRLSTGDSVAIKIIDKEKIQKVGLINQIKREISVMRMVRHPNIVELYEVMASKTKIYFAMEYARGGELFGKVAKGRLKEEAARRYFQQLIGAVDFCHSRGVYHRDLKPENLLLDDRGNLKITDFGLSALRETQRNDGLLHTTCGTPAYVAPEVIGMGGYDGAKADIWSCGVVLYVLMAGFLPFHDSNLMEMYKKISKGEFRCPQWFPAEVRKLLLRIMDPNPRSRINVAKLMENPWFKKGFRPVSIMNNVHTHWHLEAHRSQEAEWEEEEGSGSPDTPRDVREAFSGAHLLSSPPPPPRKTDSTVVVIDDDAGGSENEGFTMSCCRCSKESMKPAHMNAFDIISLSSGFNLSGLFVDDVRDGNSLKAEETRFTTDKPASAIVSRFEELAETGRFAIWKKKDGKMMLHSSRGGRKGSLAINAEIYEIAPTLHMVEVRKASGDTWEYNNFCKRDLRPALKDIVWTTTATATADGTAR